MATIRLYNMPDLQSYKNNMIMFSSTTDRFEYFMDKESKTAQIDDMINPWDLRNRITIHDNAFSYTPDARLNYAIVKNSKDPRDYYYYITGYKKKSATSVEYELQLDPFMTYMSVRDEPGLDIWSKPQLVTREHKHRFHGGGEPIFHKFPEPLNVYPERVVKAQYHEPEVDSKHNIRVRLNLDKQNYGDEFQKYTWEMFTEKEVEYDTEMPNVVMLKGNAITGTVTLEWNGSTAVIQNFPGYYIALMTNSTPSQEQLMHIRYFRESNGAGTTKATELRDRSNLSGPAFYYADGRTISINIGRGTSNPIKIIEWSTSSNYYSNAYTEFVSANKKLSDLTLETLTFAPDKAKTKTFKDLDLTDSKNTNVVELPYIPSQTPKAGSAPISFYYDAMQYLSLDNLSFDIKDPAGHFTFDHKGFYIPNNDPKLWTSQFNPLFVAWYGDAIDFKRENIMPGNTGTDTWGLKAVYDSAGFTRVKWGLNTDYIYEDDLYQLTKVTDMNNQVSTMSSDIDIYTRYLKEDDDKIRRIQESKATVNAVMSTINQGIGAVPGTSEGSFNARELTSTVGRLRAGRSTANIGATWINYAQDKQIRELEHRQKLTQLKIGAISISGGSTYLNYFDNFDKIRVYEGVLTPEQENYVGTYFHKYGYETLEYKEVEFRTRHYWDYKRIHIDESDSYAGITDEVMDYIRSKFAEGVTIFHANRRADDTLYCDFDQSMENYEVWD